MIYFFGLAEPVKKNMIRLWSCKKIMDHFLVNLGINLIFFRWTCSAFLRKAKIEALDCMKLDNDEHTKRKTLSFIDNVFHFFKI